MPCNIATNYAIHCTRGIAERLFFRVKNIESVKHGQLRKANSCNLAPVKTRDFYSWDQPCWTLQQTLYPYNSHVKK